MKRSLLWSRSTLGVLALTVVVAVAIWGCSGSEDAPVAPQAPAIVLDAANPQIKAVMAIQDRFTPDIMKHPEVIGTATTVTDAGEPAIMVLVTGKDPNTRPSFVPPAYQGIPVVVRHTDPIVAVKGPPGGGGGGGGGPSHTAKQDRPIELGVSGGNGLDIANGYCCGGTLGSLVQGGGKQYILSNSHVFVGDVVNNGNGTHGPGDPIDQPGLIDVGCQRDPACQVATVSTNSTIYPPGSTPNIDAALAEIDAGEVTSSILEIGNISSSTVAASVGQRVKKSGRTSGLTRSRVEGLNATVNVGYSDECAGSSFSKQFTGQILIRNKGSKFLDSGDSGSLMVEDVDNTPRAVGLLYAGSSQIAVANPINDVLNYFNVSMVP